MNDMNQFALVAALRFLPDQATAAFFEERRAKADRKAFRQILKRSGGQLPALGDEL